MKRFLPILLAALALGQQAGATNVSGVINGVTTFTKANSPYIITADLLVNEGAVLNIEPGVEIRANQDIRFYVDGSINAVGTANDPIVFTSSLAQPHRNSWYGLHLREKGMNDSSTFRYCKFSWMDIAILSYTSVGITRCTFINCKSGVQIGPSSFPPRFVLDSNLVTQCGIGPNLWEGWGIGVSHGIGTIIGNEVSYTGARALGARGGAAIVADNYVHDCAGGIDYSPSTSGMAQFHGNVAVNIDGVGIGISGEIMGTGIYGNISAYNKVGYVISGAKGKVQYNTARHCKTGVEFIHADGWPSQAVFKNNCIDSSIDYNVIIRNWVDVDISGNYWGTTDSTILQAKMFDFWDDFVSPKGFILPALAQPDVSCIPYTGPVVTKIPNTKNSTALITLSPNPFTTSFTIHLQGKATKLAVFNMTGQQVYAADVKGRDKMEVDMSAYPAGVYHYRIMLADNTIATGKLVKQ